ncbi:MAG: EutN/CcmL family microcompartment protein [Bacteroidales bacterium]|nr:EutN/CcmL family microcompartment protein [Bacteroidales bacterium]RLD38544.1 MAG: ethanolamine utilization protein EutN [Bacteroidota bacterium]
MILGKVVGTITSNSNSIEISGGRYLLVNKCDQKGKLKNDFLVALDLVSAGKDEMVMISESTSARETTTTKNKPIDAIIIGIIDMIDESDKVVYKK